MTGDKLLESPEKSLVLADAENHRRNYSYIQVVLKNRSHICVGVKTVKHNANGVGIIQPGVGRCNRPTPGDESKLDHVGVTESSPRFFQVFILRAMPTTLVKIFRFSEMHHRVSRFGVSSSAKRKHGGQRPERKTNG